ncbi:MAG: flippase [Lachnospiraceae bacterium]|nr:flippase [Lachnospiraceae bacterium]
MQKNSVKTNYIYHVAYQVLTMLTPLITTPYISRVLQPDGVGAYSYAYTMVQYFVLIGNLGFSTYGQIKIARHNDDLNECSQIFWEIVILRTTVFLFCLAGYGAFIWYTVRYKELYVVLSILLLSNVLDISWLYFGFEDFKSVSMRNIIVKLAGIIGIFLFVKEKEDLLIYALVLSLSTFAGSVVMWRGVHQRIQRPQWQKMHFRQHIKPTIAFFIPGIASTIYTMIDKTMIGVITSSAYENGYYEQAHKIEQIIVQFVLSIGVVLRPKMAGLYQRKEEKEIKENLSQAVTVVFMITLPMCAGLCIVAPELVSCFLGKEFTQCIPLLRIFSVLIIIIGLSGCISNLYLSVGGHQKQHTIGVYVGAAVNIALNLLFIPYMGAVGAATASVLSECVILLVFYLYSKQYFNLRMFIHPAVKYGILTMIMAGAVLLVKMMPIQSALVGTIVEITVGVIIYGGALLVAGDEFAVKIVSQFKHKIKK